MRPTLRYAPAAALRRHADRRPAALLAAELAALLREDRALAREVGKSLDPATPALLVAEAAAGSAGTPSASSGAGAVGTLGAVEAEKLEAIQKPEMVKLWRLGVRQAVPFVGFGFFDNMVMITVGDAVDSTFGVTLGFSTLAAAGFGQMVSDSVGIAFARLLPRLGARWVSLWDASWVCSRCYFSTRTILESSTSCCSACRARSVASFTLRWRRSPTRQETRSLSALLHQSTSTVF